MRMQTTRSIKIWGIREEIHKRVPLVLPHMANKPYEVGTPIQVIRATLYAAQAMGALRIADTKLEAIILAIRDELKERFGVQNAASTAVTPERYQAAIDARNKEA